MTYMLCLPCALTNPLSLSLFLQCSCLMWAHTRQADNKYHPTLLRTRSPHIISYFRKVGRIEEQMTAG